MVNFICESCKTGADIKSDNTVKKDRHTECKGKTWCDCQHRISGDK